jgi:hypothetical protein
VIHWSWGEIVLKHIFLSPMCRAMYNKGTTWRFIAKFYTPKGQESEVQKASRNKRQLPRPKPSNELI